MRFILLVFTIIILYSCKSKVEINFDEIENKSNIDLSDTIVFQRQIIF